MEFPNTSNRSSCSSIIRLSDTDKPLASHNVRAISMFGMLSSNFAQNAKSVWEKMGESMGVFTVPHPLSYFGIISLQQ